MINLTKFLGLCLLICLVIESQAQSPILDNYVKLGLENNLALKQENFSIQKSISALEEAKGLFQPNVSFLATYTLAGGGRDISFPIGDLLNPVYQTLNDMTGGNNFPTLQNQTIQFLPNDFHETKIRLIQPLFNSDIYYNYKAKKELISFQEAQKKAYEQELTKNIKTAYLQYTQIFELEKIYQRTEGLLNEVLRTNQKLVKNDKSTSEIVYGAEYEIAKLQNDKAEAYKNKKTAQAYFNFLLNRNLEENIELDSTILVKEIPTEDLISLEAQALAQRAELQQVKSGMNANLLQIELNKANKYPKVNVVGDLGYQGFGYKFDNTQDFWLVNFSLEWNLFKGKQNKRKIEQAQIEQSKLETRYTELEQQIKLQVQRAFYELQAFQKNIQANESGLRSAEKNYNLTKKKYEQGQARYIELVETQTKYINAQLALSLAQYNFLIKKVELQRLAGE